MPETENMREEKSDPLEERILFAALDEASGRSWPEIRLTAIAARAEVSMSVLYRYIGGKHDIPALLDRHIDSKLLAQPFSLADDLSPRDRLFDLVMARFDLLNEHRASVCALYKGIMKDPAQVLLGFPHVTRSMAWLLEAAGLSPEGWRGAARMAGLSALYLRVLKVWMSDDSPDMAATMAELDRWLARAENLAISFGFPEEACAGQGFEITPDKIRRGDFG